MAIVISMLTWGNLIRLIISFEAHHFYVSDYAWYVTWGGCCCLSLVKYSVGQVMVLWRKYKRLRDTSNGPDDEEGGEGEENY